MIYPCDAEIAPDGKERSKRGTTGFPIACYYDDLNLFDVPLHWHEELEAAVIEMGEISLTIGNETYQLKEGDGFFVNSGILHGVKSSCDGECRLHSMVFLPRLVGGSDESVFYQEYVNPLVKCGGNGCFVLSSALPWQNEMLSSIESIWQKCSEEKMHYEIKVRNLLSEMMVLLKEHLSLPDDYSRDSRSERDGLRMKKMLDFIHNTFDQNIRLEDIAKSADISESECLRCFRRLLSVSPVQYLKEYRVEYAKRMMLSSSAFISDIALQSGFQDISYFTKTFKILEGVTPKEYRRIHGDNIMEK